MENTPITNREVLKSARLAKGTQRKVSCDLGITETHWCQIENGKTVPGTKLLFKICHYLNKDVYQLFPDFSEPVFFENNSN